jgi:ferrous iron transport protein A
MAKSVAEMLPGETAIIAGFADEQIGLKLLELGLLPGTAIRFNFTAPFGDPICVSVSDVDLSLRINEASTISVID